MHTVKKHTNIMLSLRTQAESDAYCVGVPFSVVSDFNPLLVISLGHFLALFVLDLNTKHTKKHVFRTNWGIYGAVEQNELWTEPADGGYFEHLMLQKHTISSKCPI